MSFKQIGTDEILDGSAVDGFLLERIKDNFEYQQEEFALKEQSLAQQAQILAEQSVVISKSVPVGTVRYSTLSIAQFLAEVPGQWRLMDGDSADWASFSSISFRAEQ
ncbi:MAG: hypothetical protein PHY47_00520 [Lachnospiraceae bacterium]|nr:hypothetical protein [Lachnospiraceae bacterium]